MRVKLRELIKQWGPLFLISCLSLFLELAAIRWVAGEIKLLAYFKNLVLLAAFLGLAIGFASIGKKQDYMDFFPWLWGIFVGLVIVVGKRTETLNIIFPGGGDEFMFNSTSPSFWISLLLFIAIILVFFFLILFLFIPLGQATGNEMSKHTPVKAYIVNISASLIGVWLFSLISYLNTSPVLWFIIALLGIGIYFLYKRRFKWVVYTPFIVTLLVIGVINSQTIWSPYNRLDLIPLIYKQDDNELNWGSQLTVQHDFYQVAIDLTSEFIEKTEINFPLIHQVLEDFKVGYDLPYTLVPARSKVLIVGSGMGNDVAAALRAQMVKVTAVEIDPTILHLGQKYHPEKPYDDPRVLPVVDDARSYFNRNQEKFDLIVYGLLDSHTLLSSMSSVRLDSYVYTLESFQQAKSQLNQNGILVVTFTTNQWIEERLGRMLQQAFKPGNVYFKNWMDFTTFVAGDNLPDQSVMNQLSLWNQNPAYNDLPLATDNWPYIYLRTLRIPAGYWQTLLVIIVLCIGLMARSFPEALKPDWHFWLLGAAFLLIEFKAITELALLFGTTWFVNSLAISGVLVMALFANVIVLKSKAINLRWIYIFLFASLIFGYFFPLSLLGGYNPLIKGLIGTTVLCLPLFFAGMIFSEALKRYGETSRPIASNFSGSAVGGILEYGSIWWGIKSLYLVALVLYVGALLAAIRQRLLSK